MNQAQARALRHRRRTHARREGAALLIVLFILMMATGTAVYALQGTQLEQRAAGSLQQAMRTKYIAEAATVGLLANCLELGTSGCFNLKSGDFTSTQRMIYALPSRGTVEPLGTATLLDFNSATWRAPILPSDAVIMDTVNQGGAASPYQPSFISEAEKWSPSGGTTMNNALKRYRLVISTYGLLDLGGQQSAGGLDVNNTAATDYRDAHQSISVTRAFFEVSQ